MKATPRPFILPALILLALAHPVHAAPIETAAEVAEIVGERERQEALLRRPQGELQAKFKAALRKVEEASRAAGDPTGELAALRTAAALDDGTLAPWRIEHPEVARLAKVYFEENRKLAAEAAPGLKQARQDSIGRLEKLVARLSDAGQFQDAGLVREMATNPDATADPVIGFMELPAAIRHRQKPEDRQRMIAAGGGDPAAEKAVLRGLQHLKETQNADGSWTTANQCAMTGLALLAMLGHGETPRAEEFGECVGKAIAYLVGRGQANLGLLSSSTDKNHKPYEHAIATQALAEALIFCENETIAIPGLREAVHAAGQFVISNQHESGGWDYGYSEESSRGGDLSITSWQVGALASCQMAGLELVNLDRCVRKALDFVESKYSHESGGFGYTSKGVGHAPNGYPTLTGAGMHCLQRWGKGSVASVRGGAKFIAENSRFDFNGEDCDLYGQFFEAHAMRLRGGEAWRLHQARVMPQLIENQEPDGSWKAPGSGKKPNAVAAAFISNAHYRDCLCLLILESHYRLVPE